MSAPCNEAPETFAAPDASCYDLIDTFIAGSVVVPRTATDADVAEELQHHQDDGACGVVDPSTEEQVGYHER